MSADGLPRPEHLREADDQGGRGRLFSRFDLPLYVWVSPVKRTAEQDPHDPADTFAAIRTLACTIPREQLPPLGALDAAGHAVDLPSEGIELRMFASAAETEFEIDLAPFVFIEGPAGVVEKADPIQLRLYLASARFAWLWHEMMARPKGRLRIGISLPCYIVEGTRSAADARYYLQDYTGPLGDQFVRIAVEDDWG